MKISGAQILLSLQVIITYYLSTGTDAYVSGNNIYRNILNIMAIESVLYEELSQYPNVDNKASNDVRNGKDVETPKYHELKWEDAPLYAPTTVMPATKLSESDEQKIHHLPLAAESTALLIVDVQPEYWTHCPSVRKDFPNFERNLKNTITTCRNKQAKIIWVRADYRHYHSPWLAQFERLNGGSRPDTKSEISCDPSSKEFAWEDFATPEGGEVIIGKTSWNSASNTVLMDFLKSNRIENVLVCGLITSVCVQHSAFSIFEAGYRTLLVEDACGDRGMARHQAAIALYGNYMYEIITSEKLEDEKVGLQPAKPKWFFKTSTSTGTTDSNLNGSKRKVSCDELSSYTSSPVTKKIVMASIAASGNAASMSSYCTDDSLSRSNESSPEKSI
mmetsp:Transcript_28069/g.32155  ORF Transcript_28069/g.32155 Transcript_28069/m.32155 type:complete len:390 (+) Transcript_28069:162-1331(+)